MKKIGILIGSFALAVLLLGASTVSAQVLDNVWFKLSVSAKGYAVGMDDSATKASFKATAYMLVQRSSGLEYTYYIFSETSLGTWIETASGSFPTTPVNDEYIFLPDHDWVVDSTDNGGIHFYFTGMIRIKLDKTGNLSSATFSTLGAEVDDGETTDGKTMYGGATVKGKTCDPPGFPV